MSLLSILALVTVVVLVAALLVRAVHAWWLYHGSRVIKCPENQLPAGVSVAAVRAAAGSLLGAPKLDLKTCSRWPEKSGCGRECLSQVQEAPEDCLVRNILIRWYGGKRCAACGQPFHDISLTGAKPAVLRADKVTVAWEEIPAEKLAETLASSSPICFTCHMGNKLVRQHPELVVNRSQR